MFRRAHGGVPLSRVLAGIASIFGGLVGTAGLGGMAGGCAHAPVPTAKPVAKVEPSAPRAEATGVWDWVFRSTNSQGDVRVEQEEWHLQQKGADVQGYYDRSVTMMSTDERLFRCNRQMGFTRFTHVRVAGSVEGENLRLRELAFEAKPGPCDDGARNLVEYVGVVGEATLKLLWAPDAGQTLHRRAGAASADASDPAAARLLTAVTTLAPSGGARPGGAGIGGSWEWELKSIDAEGDERSEREVWHLTEDSDGIGGFYERTVTRVRGDGTFSCNAAGRYETVTRYTLKGARLGDKLTLAETDFKASRSACDNGQRRLDTYHGVVSADGDEIVLSWGPGNQLLRRRR